MPVKEKYYTVEEVSQELRVAPETVRRYIKRGELDALTIGGVYRIPADAYERFKISRKAKTEKDTLTQEN